jgi:hypothetical protein
MKYKAYEFRQYRVIFTRISQLSRYRLLNMAYEEKFLKIQQLKLFTCQF